MCSAEMLCQLPHHLPLGRPPFTAPYNKLKIRLGRSLKVQGVPTPAMGQTWAIPAPSQYVSSCCCRTPKRTAKALNVGNPEAMYCDRFASESHTIKPRLFVDRVAHARSF